MKIKENHIIVLRQHYPSIGHAYHDLNKNGIDSQAYQKVGNVWENIKNFGQGLLDYLKDLWEKFTIFVKKVVDEYLIFRYETVPDWLDKLGEMLSKAVISGGKLTKAFVCKMFEYTQKFWAFVKTLFTSKQYDTKELETETTACSDLFNSFGQRAYSIIETIAIGLKKAVLWLIDVFVAAALRLLQPLEHILNIVSVSKEAYAAVYPTVVQTSVHLYCTGNQMLRLYSRGKKYYEEKAGEIIATYLKKMANSNAKVLILLSNIVAKIPSWDELYEMLPEAVKKTISGVVWAKDTLAQWLSAAVEKLGKIIGYFSSKFVELSSKIFDKLSVALTTMMHDLVGRDAELTRTSHIDVDEFLSVFRHLKNKVDDFDETTQQRYGEVVTSLENIQKYQSIQPTETISEIVAKSVERVSLDATVLTDTILGNAIDPDIVNKYVYEYTGMSADQYTEYVETTLAKARLLLLDMSTKSNIPQSVDGELEDRYQIAVHNIAAGRSQVVEAQKNLLENGDKLKRYVSEDIEIFKRKFGFQNQKDINTFEKLLKTIDDEIAFSNRSILKFDRLERDVKKKTLITQVSLLILATAGIVLWAIFKFTKDEREIADGQRETILTNFGLSKQIFNFAVPEIPGDTIDDATVYVILNDSMTEFNGTIYAENIDEFRKVVNSTLTTFTNTLSKTQTERRFFSSLSAYPSVISWGADKIVNFLAETTVDPNPDTVKRKVWKQIDLFINQTESETLDPKKRPVQKNLIHTYILNNIHELNEWLKDILKNIGIVKKEDENLSPWAPIFDLFSNPTMITFAKDFIRNASLISAYATIGAVLFRVFKMVSSIITLVLVRPELSGSKFDPAVYYQSRAQKLVEILKEFGYKILGDLSTSALVLIGLTNSFAKFQELEIHAFVGTIGIFVQASAMAFRGRAAYGTANVLTGLAHYGVSKKFQIDRSVRNVFSDMATQGVEIARGTRKLHEFDLEGPMNKAYGELKSIGNDMPLPEDKKLPPPPKKKKFVPPPKFQIPSYKKEYIQAAVERMRKSIKA